MYREIKPGRGAKESPVIADLFGQNRSVMVESLRLSISATEVINFATCTVPNKTRCPEILRPFGGVIQDPKDQISGQADLILHCK